MAVDKPTERAQEALAGALRQAADRHHQLVEPEHLLLALLEQREGIVTPLLEQAGVSLDTLRQAAEAAVAKRPEVRGADVDQQVSPAFARIMRKAGSDAESMGDQYISTEHLIGALLAEPAPARCPSDLRAACR